MAAPYIPAKDAQFDTWILNFNTLVQANFLLYGLTSADASASNTNTGNWSTAYATATSGATRTKANIATKDSTKAAVTAFMRNLANQIQANTSVTNADKAALGLTVRKTVKTPIAAPVTSPVLTFVAGTPGQQTLAIADTLTPAKKAKPAGVIQGRLFIQVGGVMPTSSATMALAQTVTRTPFAVSLPSGSSGKTVYYIAVWSTRRGLVGPDSAVLSAAAV
jgi:hypothetical protein